MSAATDTDGLPINPESLAVHIGFDNLLSALEDRRKAWPVDDREYNNRLAEKEADLRRYARRLQDSDTEHWEAVADRAIKKRGLSITKGSDAYIDFVQTLAEASIDAIGVFTRRSSGDLDAAPRTAVVQRIKAKEADTAAFGESIMELFERWADEALAKGEKRQDTVNQDRKVVQQFAAFVGKDRSVRSVSPLEVAEYREILRDLPPKWMSNNALKGLRIADAAKRARELKLAQTAFTTVNKHLSTISPLYKWLAAQPKWAGLRNPCDGLFFQKVKGRNRRPSFSTEQLNVILTSPLFKGFQSDGKEHLPGNQQANDWRKWVPLSAMFSGARIGEIAQLRIGDVRKDRGRWFMHIKEDEEEGLRTKSRKNRPAAVHATLEGIGFLIFHAQRLEQAGGDQRAPLFPELEPNARGQISGTPSRWWRDYLDKIGVKDGGDCQSACKRDPLSARKRDPLSG